MGRGRVGVRETIRKEFVGKPMALLELSFSFCLHFVLFFVFCLVNILMISQVEYFKVINLLHLGA